MKKKSRIRVLSLTGTPRERGKLHGESMETEILEVLERYKYRHTRRRHDKIIDSLYQNTNFLPVAKKWAPQLVEEIEGVAEGARVDFKELFAMHLLAHDENWWLVARKSNPESCTSIGAFRESDRSAILGQNMDLNNLFEGLEVLLHIKHQDSSLESFVLSHAGFLAECGVNNQPLGICCNSLVAPLNHSTNGLPVTFIVRSVLEQTSLKKALEFLNKIPHASGQNYMIGGYEKVVSMECSPNVVSQYIPFEGARTVFHTNHPLINSDKKSPEVKYRSGSTTFNRFRYVKNRLRDHKKKFSVDIFKYILSSHFGPVCVHHDNTPASSYTYSSVIYELTRPPTLHITVGPPCLTEYQRFDFS